MAGLVFSTSATMDWLLSLPDPRADADEDFSGGVLRPLRPSATQPKLPTRHPPGAGNNSGSTSNAAAARRPAGGVGTRMRRPGSGQQQKLSRPSLGLGTPTSASVGVSGAMSVSGGSFAAAGLARLNQPPPPSAGLSGAAPPVVGGRGNTLGTSATDSTSESRAPTPSRRPSSRRYSWRRPPTSRPWSALPSSFSIISP